MIGTIVNTISILTGSCIGHVFKQGIKEEYKAIMLQSMGLVATVIGINSVVSNMPKSNYQVLFIVSLTIGGLIGQKINLEKRFNKLTKKNSHNNLSEGLSTAILLFCVGALSIVGPIESALNGNNTLLFTNAILDGITSIVLASNFGIGIAVSSVILFIFQSTIYFSAQGISGFITPDLLTEISIVGGILILSSGLGILNIKKINTLNLLPSLLIPVIFFIIKGLL